MNDADLSAEEHYRRLFSVPEKQEASSFPDDLPPAMPVFLAETHQLHP